MLCRRRNKFTILSQNTQGWILSKVPITIAVFWNVTPCTLLRRHEFWKNIAATIIYVVHLNDPNYPSSVHYVITARTGILDHDLIAKARLAQMDPNEIWGFSVGGNVDWTYALAPCGPT